MWKNKEEKKEEKEKEEDKKVSLLKELCGDDKKLYDLLSNTLYINPVPVISKTDLESLIEEADEMIKDENYQGAMQKYQIAVNKAIFEASLNPGEMARYVKVIRDLSSKAAKVAEKIKNGEKEGFDYSYFEGRVKHYEFMSERAEDVVRIASIVYNERLEELGEAERRKERSIERGDVRRAEERADMDAKEMRKLREKERKGNSGEWKREAEKKDREEEKSENDRAVERMKEGIETERKEKILEDEEEERRESRRKEIREKRKT